MSEGWIERVSAAEGRKLLSDASRKAHKYHAKPCVVDGVRFDSKAESREYLRLRILQRNGFVSGLERQPAFELHAPNGEVLGKYVADFQYVETYGHRVVVSDVKGMKTLPLARWKQRHLRAEYGIVVEERRS